MDQPTDDQIIDGIYRNDQAIITWIYKTQLPRIEKLVINKGGDLDSARDIFQEAMFVIFNKVREKKFVLTSSFSTYLFAICRNLWFQELRTRHPEKYVNVEVENVVEEPVKNQETEEEIMELIHFHFDKLSEDCKKVLELHFKKVSLTEITSLLGYKDEKYASDRKYRCKKRLFDLVTNDPKYKKIMNGLY